MPYPAGAQMATTGVAAEASSLSRRPLRGTMPGRPSAGASFDSRTGNGGPAGIGLHGWIGMVGWLRIMSIPAESYRQAETMVRTGRPAIITHTG